MKSALRRTLAYTLCIAALVSCSTNKTCQSADCLSSITLLDRHGMSETISSGERLKRHQSTDFRQPQTFESVLRMFGRDADGGIRSVLSSYHPNGQVHQELEAYNGRALGSYREWHQNGQLKLEAEVIGGLAELANGAEKSWLFDGVSSVWSDEGCLVAEIPYEKGVLEGVSRHYHPNGQIWKESPFAGGRIDGCARVYLADGQLLESAQYREGRRHGETRRFWNQHHLSTQELYQQDLLVSGRYMTLEGELVSEIKGGNGMRSVFTKTGIARQEEFRDGQMEGRVSLFNSEGRMLRSYHVKNGVKHGEETEYYVPRLIAIDPHIAGQEKLSVNWYGGVLQGTSRSWYDNGQLESQREMSDNAKEGVCTAWYRDGSLMFVEEYDRDKIVSGKYLRPNDHIAASRISDGEGVATLFDPDGNFLRKVNYEEGRPVER